MKQATFNSVPHYPMDSTSRRLANKLEKYLSDGQRCSFVVRAPGRVNLIGEHIDYNGYSVLPMALEQAIMIAVAVCPSVSDGGARCLALENVSDEYKRIDISLDKVLSFGKAGPPKHPDWYDYFLCGYCGVADYAKANNLPWKPPCLHVLVGSFASDNQDNATSIGGSNGSGESDNSSASEAKSKKGEDKSQGKGEEDKGKGVAECEERSELVAGAGLSSSSALVVAAALATARAADLDIGRRELASLTASCEQLIGTLGGGMDQAACLLAEQGSALLVEFTRPLVTATPVPLPPGVAFVVMHCGVRMNKATSDQFNRRVVECRIAAKLLMNSLSQSDKPTFSGEQIQKHEIENKIYRLADVEAIWNLARENGSHSRTISSETDNLDQLLERLPEGVVTREQLASLLTTTELNVLLSNSRGTFNEFKLRARARHVFSEAKRVAAFHRICCSQDYSPEHQQRLLGDLMNDSQTSCSRDYECSCPELDRLTEAARQAGALGSRLTGAGWGGCLVSLVPQARVPEFMRQLRAVCGDANETTVVAAQTEKKEKIIKNKEKCCCFVSRPGQPAGYLDVV